MREHLRQSIPENQRALLLLLWPFAPYRQLLWPLLTPRSASPRRPFSHEARSPQVRTRSFTAQPPDLRRLSLDHKSFAECCLLALLGTASYPVLVHRLAVSLHASFPHSVALMQLRFASFAVANLREDFHLQDRAHAGRTTKSRSARLSIKFEAFASFNDLDPSLHFGVRPAGISMRSGLVEGALP